jgi:hypothetical protein
MGLALMWDWITPKNLIEMQRKTALDYMGEQARLLLKDGYVVEADQVLDEMLARRDSWREERA